MTMNPKLARLMSDVLELQTEPAADFDDLAFALAVRAALANGEDLRPELVALIWRSPDARSIYLDLRRESLAAVRQRWTRNGFATQFERMAADSDADTGTVHAAGLAIQMVHNRATSRWVVSLRLTADAQRELPSDIGIRVADSGGKVWLEGRIDRHGGLDSFWEDELDPRARAHRFGLALTFF